MKILIFGAGNLLLSDEGFGVHFVRRLEEHYRFPDQVELFDAGAMGIMVTHKLEEADRVYVIDVLDMEGPPGQRLRFCKDDFMLKRIPVKLSPHQIGVQEALLIMEMRGRCPNELILLGIIPQSLEPGSELSPLLQQRLIEMADSLVAELRADGIVVEPK